MENPSRDSVGVGVVLTWQVGMPSERGAAQSSKSSLRDPHPSETLRFRWHWEPGPVPVFSHLPDDSNSCAVITAAVTTRSEPAPTACSLRAAAARQCRGVGSLSIFFHDDEVDTVVTPMSQRRREPKPQS